MQDKTSKTLTWVLLSAAALGQLLITAALIRQSMDLVQPDGTTLPVGYIDVRMYGNTLNVIGASVIALVVLTCVLCVYRSAHVTLGAMLVSILLLGTFLGSYFTSAELDVWLWGAGVVLLALLFSFVWENTAFARRRRVPDDASSLTPTSADDAREIRIP